MKKLYCKDRKSIKNNVLSEKLTRVFYTFPFMLLSVTDANAVCSITPGGTASSSSSTDTCILPDGNYSNAGSAARTISGNTGKMINSGSLNIAVSGNDSSIYRGASSIGTTGFLSLHNVNIDMRSNSGLAGFVGVQASSGAASEITGDLNIIGSNADSLWGVVPGSRTLGNYGNITLNNVNILLNDFSYAEGVSVGQSANASLVVNGNLQIDLNSNKSQKAPSAAIYMANFGTLHLKGNDNNIVNNAEKGVGASIGHTANVIVDHDINFYTNGIGLLMGGGSTNAGGGNAYLNGKSTIATLNGNGVDASKNSRVEFNGDTNISVQGNDNSAVYAYDSGTIFFNGTRNDFSTQGISANGIWVNNGSQGQLSGLVNISTRGSDSTGLKSTGGNSSLSVNNADVTFDITGADSWAIKAANTGDVRLTNSTLHGATILSNNNGSVTLDDTSLAGAHLLLTTNGQLISNDNVTALGSLAGDNTGLITLSNGNSLILGASAATGDVRVDSADYAGHFAGPYDLVKTGSKTQILSGTGNTVGSVDVGDGTLRFIQDGVFTTLGNFTTQNGATLSIGNPLEQSSSTTLNVGGVFTQSTGSTLDITLGAAPDIVANTANLAGNLIFRGFSSNSNMSKASSIQNGDIYEMIRTENSILGTYAEVDGVDYLISDGFIGTSSTNINNASYYLGFRLAWIDGGDFDGNGSFTLSEGTGFDVDIALNNQLGNFSSGWNGKDLVKNGDGELMLSAQNNYTGKTQINSGSLYLSGSGDISSSRQVELTSDKSVLDISNITSSTTKIQNLSGVSGSQIKMAGKYLNVSNTENTSFAGNIDASAGGLIKDGAGDLSLSGKTLFTGNTLVDQGKLILDGSTGGAQLVSNVVGQSGAILSLQNGASLTGGIDPLDVAIDRSSTWNMTTNSLVDNINLAGHLNVDHREPAFKTLIVNGNWSGNDGTILINTVLGTDDSNTDQIKISGDSSGTTNVKVNNVGGLGAQTVKGIRVIEVKGSSDGTFKQDSRIVAGAYDYFLGRGHDDKNNWYLTSKRSEVDPEPVIVRPEVGAYTSNLFDANNMFVTRLHDRLGETQYVDALTGEQKVTSMWLRNVVGENRSRDANGQLKNRSSRYVVQLGGDIAQWSDSALSRGHLGIMGGYGNSNNNTHSSYTGYRADGNVEGYSVGLYGTWYENEKDKAGLYVDGWALYNWFDNTVSGQGIATDSYNSKGVTASLESGYTFRVGENTTKKETYFIQPKAQVTWMGVKADDHNEVNGTRVEGKGDDNVQTRLGARAFVNINKTHDINKNRVFQPFVETNWIHNTKSFGSRMDGVTVGRDGTDNIAELKIGVEGQLGKEFQVWSNVSQQVGGAGYSDTVAMLGVKYSFQ